MKEKINKFIALFHTNELNEIKIRKAVYIWLSKIHCTLSKMSLSKE